MKRLLDLAPKFLGHGGDGISDKNGNPVPMTNGVGIYCECPCGCANPLYVPFTVALDGTPYEKWYGEGNAWVRHGSTFEELTLTPSIQRIKSAPDSCDWHGWLTNGVFKSCDEPFSDADIEAFKKSLSL